VKKKTPSARARGGLACVFGMGFVAALVSVAYPRAAVAEDPAAASFVEVAKVLQSPRCLNCHPIGDQPLQGDDAKPHRMKISRRGADAGLPCTTCHQNKNAPFLHGPPGVPNWKLPPRDMPMVFQGKSVHDLCEQMKDPARNGHKSLADLKEHMGHDPLVLWGWDPGPGRTKPPLSHEDFAAHVNRWVDAGAPCPP
jgi:hypothetical protein